MGIDLKKYIAIRYNTATGYRPSQWNGEGAANLDPAWLAERLDLFDSYCAFSLESQSAKDFTVLVAFDKETGADTIQTVCGCARDIDIRPILVAADESHNARFNAFVQNDTDAEFVTITRLDSDDALAPSFMARVDRYARREIAKGTADQQPLYIAFPHGQNFDRVTNRYTHHDYVTSAFGTMLERRSPSMKGIYSDHHAKMAGRFNTVVAEAKGAQWCIVIHDNNVANVLRGKPIKKPSFTVGRPGTEYKKRKPDSNHKKPQQNGPASGVAPRTMDNLVRFVLGRPMRLRK
jgi:hypothetical protein